MKTTITKKDLISKDTLIWCKSYVKTTKKAYKLNEKLNKKLKEIDDLMSKLS